MTERYLCERPGLDEALKVWGEDLRQLSGRVDKNAYVDGRVKTHRSVVGKLYRTPGAVRAWESLGDLVALKVVFPTVRGVDRFTELLSSVVAYHPELDDRKPAPDRLGYAAKQFDLWRADLVDTRGEPIKVEVQVRTAAADAWYVIDHRLKYKGIVELPDDLKRKVLRLTVLAELFDHEVDAIIQAQCSLEHYAVARAYETATRMIDELTDGLSAASRPEGLFETLLGAYGEGELPAMESIIDDFIGTDRDAVSDVIRKHRFDNSSFVEERDYLYSEPEAVIIAERARHKPAMLRGAIAGSNYETLVMQMITAFASESPPHVD